MIFFSEAADIMMLTNAKNPPNTINISETVPNWGKKKKINKNFWKIRQARQ